MNCNQLAPIRKIADLSFSKRWTDQDFAYFLAHANGMCMGGFEAYVLVGYFIGLLVQGDLDVISIAVREESRRQGWAEYLMNEAIGRVGVERVFLEVDSENHSAIALYLKLGFVTYGKRKGYYKGVKDAVLMKKETI